MRVRAARRAAARARGRAGQLADAGGVVDGEAGKAPLAVEELVNVLAADAEAAGDGGQLLAAVVRPADEVGSGHALLRISRKRFAGSASVVHSSTRTPSALSRE